jgi:hypothetical protein
MRENGQRGYIWADAICINQSDVEEKTEQVRMMGDIYEAAQIVVIWLGPEEHSDRAGLYLMKDLCDKVPMNRDPQTARDNAMLDEERLIPTNWWVCTNQSRSEMYRSYC